MVRECSHCASTDRGKSSRSHYILQQSVLNSKINEISAKDREGRVLHANASTGSGLQGERNLRSVESVWKHRGATDDKKKFRQQTRGALRVLAAVRVVMERYTTSVTKNNTADRKAVKVLLNNKMATVRIDAKVESFISTVAHLRQPNKRERERGVDKAYRVTDRIPFKRAKAIHMVHIIGELQARPTIIFALDINHKNAITITKLKEFEGSQKCFKPLTDFFQKMLQDETVNPEISSYFLINPSSSLISSVDCQ
jgi:ribosomal protein S12